MLSVVGTARGNDRTAVAAVVEVTAGQRAHLELFLDEIERVGRRLNLSTVPRDQAWARHVGESLALLRVAAPLREAAVIDVGSGAGLPGIVIAIVRPDLRVTLLEADSRKAGFLTHAAGLLGLASLTVENRRAEDAGHDGALRERFDVAVSRAAAAPAVLCELALPFVRPGGRLVSLVAEPESAAPTAAVAAGLCGGGPPQPRPGGVLVVPKLTPTLDRYPRRAGVPARRPLG